MRSLSLANNRLYSLPQNLSSLKGLKKLSLKNNPFTSIASIVEALKSLPNLRELTINLKTSADAQLIIDSLHNLEILNGEKIDNSDEEDNKSEECKFTIDSAFKDLTEVIQIYEKVRLIRKTENPEDALCLGKYFESQMTLVVKELKSKLSENIPEDIRRTMILKTKHVLINTAFNKMVEIYPGRKNMIDIWKRISEVYRKLFEAFAGLLIEVISKLIKPNTISDKVVIKNNSCEDKKKTKFWSPCAAVQVKP